MKENFVLTFALTLLFAPKGVASRIQMSYNESRSFENQYGGNITGAIYDIIKSFSSNHLSIAFDSFTGEVLIRKLSTTFFLRELSLSIYNITTVEQQEEHFQQLQTLIEKHRGLITVYFCSKKRMEFIMIELQERNFIRRNLYYMFYWGKEVVSGDLLEVVSETMKILIITNPRFNAYRLYYNQATSSQQNYLKLINWWINGVGLYQHPTLPNAERIFRNFDGRIIEVPVLHKPPWHFVKYLNDSVEVLGGRDDKLLKVIAQKLNFQFKYIDPPERSQGTSFNANGSFEGVLGLIWRREAEFFLGDVALTLDRSLAVEFSFFTLADSGAFVTHAPNKLNEAFSLIRPFQWKVWPAIIFTVILSGPVLYLLIAAPNKWHPKFIVKSQSRLFFDCIWYTLRLYLKQSNSTFENT